MKAFVESGEGMAVILLCAVESNPLSEITLLKGGQPVASSPPAGGDHPGQSGHISPAPNALRLELREASEEDEGEYECRARSPLGSARASLLLRVQGESGFAAGGGTRGWGPPGRAGVGIEGYGPNKCFCWAAEQWGRGGGIGNGVGPMAGQGGAAAHSGGRPPHARTPPKGDGGFGGGKGFSQPQPRRANLVPVRASGLSPQPSGWW